MHKGYDLYSAAVPIGLVAFFLRAVLYRVLGGTLPDGAGVGAGDGNWAVANLFCFAAFALALVLFAGIRERLELEDVPESFRGTPIALVTAGILAMAFMGFSGLV